MDYNCTEFAKIIEFLHDDDDDDDVDELFLVHISENDFKYLVRRR